MDSFPQLALAVSHMTPYSTGNTYFLTGKLSLTNYFLLGFVLVTWPSVLNNIPFRLISQCYITPVVA